MAIDLYADGPLAQWASEQFRPSDVARFITHDPNVYSRACDMSLNTLYANHPFAYENTAPVALSIHFHKVFSISVIEQYAAIYNIHPGFLPWGRGYCPVFWALVEQTPAGATLHVVDEAVDKGFIIDQGRVANTDNDTGASLYSRVQAAEKRLLIRHWDEIAAGKTLPSWKAFARGTSHSKRDFELTRERYYRGETSSLEGARIGRALLY